MHTILHWITCDPTQGKSWLDSAPRRLRAMGIHGVKGLHLGLVISLWLEVLSTTGFLT